MRSPVGIEGKLAPFLEALPAIAAHPKLIEVLGLIPPEFDLVVILQMKHENLDAVVFGVVDTAAIACNLVGPAPSVADILADAAGSRLEGRKREA